MIDLSPPEHVTTTVRAIHRFIEAEALPIEQGLSQHLINEHLYLRQDGRLAPEVLAAQQTIRKRSAEQGLYALHMPKEVGGGGKKGGVVHLRYFRPPGPPPAPPENGASRVPGVFAFFAPRGPPPPPPPPAPGW